MGAILSAYTAGSGSLLLQPSGDVTGVTDTAAIPAALRSSKSVQLAIGVFWINSPLFLQALGLHLFGSGGATASGNDAPSDLGTVLKLTSTFSTTPVTNGPPSNAGIMLLPLVPGSAGTTLGLRVHDLWVDGTNAPASVDGISVFGDVGAYQFERVGVYKATGNGYAEYPDTLAGKSPDGGHLYSMVCQQCGAGGFNGKFIDATCIDCHAQSCTGDGWTITASNNRFIGCRSDLNNNGYTIAALRPAVPAQFHDSIILDACGTQGNNKNGLNLTNTSASGQGLQAPVIANGCSFDGDGVNGGAGGGGFAGIAVAGRNTLSGSGNTVNVMTYNTSAAPQYAVATASIGTGPGVPDVVNLEGGWLNSVNATPVNDAAPTWPGGLRVLSSNMSYGGGEYSAQASTKAVPYPSLVPFGSTPTAPAATASTTVVMMGLGTNATGTPWAYTPASSGNLLVTVTGFAHTNTAAVTGTIGCRYGTGAAPANGAAPVGTRFGAAGDGSFLGAAAAANVPFSFTAVLALVPGTAYWFDIALATSVGADTAAVVDVSISITETS